MPTSFPIKAFGAIFVVVGAALTAFISFPMISGVVRSQKWPAVPCQVSGAWVEEHEGDESTTYSVEVQYSYSYNGLNHVGHAYNFNRGSSSGWQGKQEIVDRLNASPLQTCFVDPEEPETAVIDREPGLYLLFALFPLPFLAVGAICWFLPLRSEE